MTRHVPKAAPGWNGWVAIGLVVVAAELLDGKTMSTAFKEAARHKRYGIPVTAAWLTLTAHLFGWLPPRFDPFGQLATHTFAKGKK
jgi:hypothetical protein